MAYKTLKEYYNGFVLDELPKKEELKLAKIIQQNEGNLRRDAANELVRHNMKFIMGFVLKQLRKVPYSGEDPREFIQNIYQQAYSAAIDFDPGRDVRYITYAIYRIRNGFMKVLRDGYGPVKSSPNAQMLSLRFNSMDDQISLSEKAALLGTDEQSCLAALGTTSKALSLDYLVGDDMTFMDALSGRSDNTCSNIEDNIYHRELISVFEKIINGLEPKRRRIMQCRMNGDTLEETGKILKLSRERVRQLQESAITQIRQKLLRSYPEIGAMYKPAKPKRKCKRRQITFSD